MGGGPDICIFLTFPDDSKIQLTLRASALGAKGTFSKWPLGVKDRAPGKKVRERRVKSVSLFFFIFFPLFHHRLKWLKELSIICEAEIILKEWNTYFHPSSPLFKALTNFCPYSQIIEHAWFEVYIFLGSQNDIREKSGCTYPRLSRVPFLMGTLPKTIMCLGRHFCEIIFNIQAAAVFSLPLSIHNWFL